MPSEAKVRELTPEECQLTTDLVGCLVRNIPMFECALQYRAIASMVFCSIVMEAHGLSRESMHVLLDSAIESGSDLRRRGIVTTFKQSKEDARWH